MRACDPLFDQAARSGERTAFIDHDGRRVSFGELAAVVEAMAADLAERGVRPGDRLLIVGENSVAMIAALFAAQKIDAWPALVNARIPSADIAAMAQAVAARAVLYVVDGSSAAADHAHGAGLNTTALPCGRGAMTAVDEAAEPETDRRVGMLLFTSGTTGRPKAVMWSHQAMINTGSSAVEARRLTADDVLYGAAPLSHVMGMAFFVMTTICAGACTRLVPRLDLPDLVRAVAGREMTFLMGVPTLFARLLEYAEPRGIDLSRHGLRNLIAGGAPLDAGLKARVEKAFGAPLGNGLAMTECTPIMRTVYGRPAEPESVGIPQGNAEVRLMGEDGEVKDGAPGELWVRGPSLMLGYYRDPEATDKVMRPGGWFATGDLARRLPNGEYALVGRIKEIIIRSGFNVHPAEVEAAVSSHLGVAQCAVVGKPGSEGEEIIIAFVQPMPGKILTADEIATHVAPLLAPYKRPQRIVLLDSLPLGPTGKVRKSQLAARTD